jgi:hypothetical protein
MTRIYILLADLLLLLHFGFVLFVVAGQALVLLGWFRDWTWTRRPIFRWVHFVCIGIVVLQSWFGVPCPLTVWEGDLREKAGDLGGGYETSFIRYWVGSILFYEAPAWVFGLIYSLFGFLVAVTLFAFPPRRRSKVDRAAP